MANVVAKNALKHVMKSRPNEIKGELTMGNDDPLYADKEVIKPNGKIKIIRVKKQIPAYLSPHDGKILKKARKRAHRLDMGFSILGYRVGTSFLFAFFIPELGDFIDTFWSCVLYWRMGKIEGGLPKSIRRKMHFYIARELLIGFLPFIGAIANGHFRANASNVRLLEMYLDDKYNPENLEKEHKPPATFYDKFVGERGPGSRGVSPAKHGHSASEPRRPDAARVHTSDRRDTYPGSMAENYWDKKHRGGWFSGRSKQERRADLEAGQEGPLQPPRGATAN